ncbi:MAG: hypothetical protein DRG78_02405 [Epsilonproteobacteria bacterium]|nr:MAG: hypothetical protein DRG78_02405 [Campylobacterota bacterium]
MINITKLILIVGLLYSSLLANENEKENKKEKEIDQKIVKTVENSMLLMSQITDKLIKLEKTQNKDKHIVDGKVLTKVEKAQIKTKNASNLNKAYHGQMNSKLNLQKSYPVAIGYYKINNNKYATVNFQGVQFNLEKGNSIAGFRLLAIYDNRLKFSTPYGQTISAYYETLVRKGKKR